MNANKFTFHGTSFRTNFALIPLHAMLYWRESVILTKVSRVNRSFSKVELTYTGKELFASKYGFYGTKITINKAKGVSQSSNTPCSQFLE